MPAQKPVRSQRALTRDRDSRPCLEICPFSESVTVIIKIEDRDLDRRPECGLPYYARVERDRSHRSDRAIDDRCASGCAMFVPMMESTDLGKCDYLVS